MYFWELGVALVVAAYLAMESFAFDVGMKNTKCNLDPLEGDINDPCGSLYDGKCVHGHCVCASGYHEDLALRRCIPGEGPKKTTGGSQSPKSGGGGSLFDDDILSSYDPNKPNGGEAPQPKPPAQPQPSGDVSEKVGGGVGGVLGLLLIGGLIYFCCIKGGRGKNILSKIPGVNFRQGGAGGEMQIQQQSPPMQDPNATSQHTYVPPGQPGAPPQASQYTPVAVEEGN